MSRMLPTVAEKRGAPKQEALAPRVVPPAAVAAAAAVAAVEASAGMFFVACDEGRQQKAPKRLGWHHCMQPHEILHARGLLERLGLCCRSSSGLLLPPSAFLKASCCSRTQQQQRQQQDLQQHLELQVLHRRDLWDLAVCTPPPRAATATAAKAAAAASATAAAAGWL
ncbi:hypothetical protein ACSSS7_000798 [Eimeria intestinalis]